MTEGTIKRRRRVEAYDPNETVFSSWGEVGEKNVSLQEGEGEKMMASFSSLPFSLAGQKRRSK
jgi:hypothetical protein